MPGNSRSAERRSILTTTNELKPLLKRLKLGYLFNTLPERLTLARQEGLDYATFLQILLSDEVARRDNRNLEVHLQKAGLEETCRSLRILIG